MVGASLAARRAEPTSCQHPFPSRGFDSFANSQGNDRNSRDADGRSSTYCGHSRLRPGTPQLGGERAHGGRLGKCRCPRHSRRSIASAK